MKTSSKLMLQILLLTVNNSVAQVSSDTESVDSKNTFRGFRFGTNVNSISDLVSISDISWEDSLLVNKVNDDVKLLQSHCTIIDINDEVVSNAFVPEYVCPGYKESEWNLGWKAYLRKDEKLVIGPTELFAIYYLFFKDRLADVVIIAPSTTFIKDAKVNNTRDNAKTFVATLLSTYGSNPSIIPRNPVMRTEKEMQWYGKFIKVRYQITGPNDGDVQILRISSNSLLEEFANYKKEIKQHIRNKREKELQDAKNAIGDL